MQTTAQKTVQKRVLIDLDRCVECRSCAAACYYSHANMPAVNFARGGWALLPIICRQCKSAPCVDVCPAEAMVCDENGVVQRRLLRCIGCGSCARACPFGVIPNRLGGSLPTAKVAEQMTGHQVAKCDLCADRTAGGGNDPENVPRCVPACPSGALIFADEQRAAELKIDVIGGRTTGQNPFKRR